MGDVKRLQAIYDRGISFQITAIYDAGFLISIGDYINGLENSCELDTLEEAIDWLEEQTRKDKESK